MDQLEGQDIFVHDFIQEHEENLNGKLSEIQQFYENTVVFITGATGFLGQILLEKLLRSTKVKRVYALVRTKDGKTPQDRLDAILSIASCRESFRSLVTVIPGDCELTNLGVSDGDRKVLIHNVDLVFHAAASSPWGGSFKQHVVVNIRGAESVLALVKEMRHVQAFLFVSTVFGQGPRVEERVTYTGKWNSRKLLTLVGVLDDEDLKFLENSIWQGFPSPQIFTKIMAETLIRDAACEFPVGIFRPSLLVSTAFEPLVGWLSDAQGVQKTVHLSLSGLLRVFKARQHCKAEIVPVDLAANALLAFAWSIGNTWGDGPNMENVEKTVTDPAFMNFTSGRLNPITWGFFIQQCLKNGLAFPKLADHAFPHVVMLYKLPLLWFFQTVLHFLPAVFFDAVLYLTGRETIWTEFYKNLDGFSKIFGNFTTKQFYFRDKTVSDLWARLGNADRTLFNFHIPCVNWKDFIQLYVRGIRIYFVKEDISTLPDAKKRMARLKILFHMRKLVQIGLLILIFAIVLKFFRTF